MVITIVGLGLIGGSMAKDLRKRGFADKIIGVDNNAEHSRFAQQEMWVDEICNLQTAVKRSEIIVIATPVDVAERLLPKILNLTTHQAVTDVCSTKKTLSEIVGKHENRKNYVPAHPMAGTENNGPKASMEGLFDNKVVIFTDPEQAGKLAKKAIFNLFNTLKMRSIEMTAAEHDAHAAYVSHISHISSMALANTVLEKEKNEKHIFDLASGGFNSTVRLAKSDAAMWTPILINNSKNILEVLDTYMEKLLEFRSAITEQKSSEITSLIHKSNEIRRILNN